MTRIARCGGCSAVALALLTANCARERTRPEIRIGLLALLSGLPAETSGRPSIEGAELAVREVNEAGASSSEESRTR